MAQDLHAPPATYGAGAHHPGPQERAGWTAFAGTMFALGAVINGMYGIVALANDQFFSADELLFWDLTTWGIAYLVVAGLQLLTTILLFRGSRAGIWLGTLLALTHALLALLTVGAYPIWSLTAIAVDGVILYALMVHSQATEA